MFIDTLDGISTINFASGYSFDLIAVFRDPELGDFWWTADSGCSCPQPFDHINGFEDMNVLNEHTWREFSTIVATRNESSSVRGAERLSWLRNLATTIRELRSQPFVPAVPNPFQEES